MGLRDNDQTSLASIGKDLEKVDIIETYNANKYANIGLSPEDAEFFDNYPEDKKKKVLRKIDIRLVPVLALLYLVRYLFPSPSVFCQASSHPRTTRAGRILKAQPGSTHRQSKYRQREDRGLDR